MTLWVEGRDAFIKQLQESGEDPKTIREFLQDRSTWDEAMKSAGTVRTESEQKYGRVHKWVNVLIDNMDRFVDVGNVVMQGAPESIGIAWFAIKCILDAVTSNKKLYDFFGTSLTEITDMMVLITTYDSLYHRGTQAKWDTDEIAGQLFDRIRRVYIGILDYSFAVKKYISASRKRDKAWHRLGDLLDTNRIEFEDKLETIKTLKRGILEDTQAAFEQGTFKGLEEITGQIKDVQSSFDSMMTMVKKAMDSSYQQNEETRRMITEELNRPKTHFELALQTFNQNKLKLSPLPNSESALKDYSREPDTCTWLLELPEYVKWRNSPTSCILGIKGKRSSGKSTIAAFVVETLQLQLASDQEYCVLYHFYDQRPSEDTNSSMQDVRTLENTLIHSLYMLCTQYQNEPMILQQANEAFTNPKQAKAEKKGTQNTAGKNVVSFPLAEIYESITLVLKKKIFLILDGIDVIKDLTAFVTDLKELLVKEQVEVHVLLTSSQPSQLSDLLQDQKLPHVTIGHHNEHDVDTIIRRRLNKIPGLSQYERKEAFESIKAKTSNLTGYATQIGIPFLQQPFPRPISKHLAKLPLNMDETYSRHVRQLSPNYLELLKVSLKWVLLGQQEIRLREIMDDYTSIYRGDRVNMDGVDASNEIDYALYVEQIRMAGGPFLETVSRGSNPIIAATDYKRICDYVFVLETDKPADNADKTTLCSNCEEQLVVSSLALTMSRREAELQMAITCMKHLNSSAFQKIYFPDALSDKYEASHPASGPTSALDPQISTGTADGNDSVGNDSVGNKEVQEDSRDITKAESDDVELESLPEVNMEDNPNENITFGPYDGIWHDDESVDSEDRSEHYWGAGVEDLGAGAEEEPDLRERYELQNWHKHVQNAEELWSREERLNNADWKTLLDEFRIFFVLNLRAFHAWRFEQPDLYMESHPLFLAARCGLVSLVELLIAEGADINMKHDLGISNVLYTATWAPKPLPILRLLLQKGADPNLEMEYSEMTVLYSLLREDPDKDCVQELLDHGACCIKKGECKPYTSAIHWFAMYGTKIEVLHALIDSEAAVGNHDYINARDEYGETALHKLMVRSPIPQNVLQEMISRGADVNVEDAESEQPLYGAAHHGDTMVIKAIIDKVKDIDDQNCSGWSAIHIAAWNGYKDTVEFLLNYGVKANDRDKRGRTPLFLACLGKDSGLPGLEPTSEIILERLIQNGYSVEDINVTSTGGRTVLREASARGCMKVVRYILENIHPGDSTTINLRDKLKGRTALHKAAMRGHAVTVALLLERGADFSLRDGVGDAVDKGKTALELCRDRWEKTSQQMYEHTIILLVDKCPQEAAKDILLMNLAATKGSVSVLEKLFNANADFNRPDQYGWTPLLLAQRCRHKDAEKFLSSRVTQSEFWPSSWLQSWDPKSYPPNWFGSPTTWPVLVDDDQIVQFSQCAQIRIFANRPIPAGLRRYYYEIEILDFEFESHSQLVGFENGDQQSTLQSDITSRMAKEQISFSVSMGYATTSDPNLITSLGWPNPHAPSVKSWGYDGGNGGECGNMKGSSESLPKWGRAGDVIGAGVDFEADSDTIWFTLNGKKVSKKGIHGVKGRLFPVIEILGSSNEVLCKIKCVFDRKDRPHEMFKWKGEGIV